MAAQQVEVQIRKDREMVARCGQSQSSEFWYWLSPVEPRAALDLRLVCLSQILCGSWHFP